MTKRAILALADGTTFEGHAFGASGEATGEVVFNTSMTGYQEILTDPSYVGQMICMTYPEQGNYGVTGADEESARPHATGFIVRHHAEEPSNFRLCKGIYVEPRPIAFTDPELIRRNFTLALDRMLERGAYVGIATHDEILVWEALRLIRKHRLARDAYEFQMLLGVDEELRNILLADGHRLRVYVPFGRQWYAYSVRRLRENPQIAGYGFRAMFKRA